METMDSKVILKSFGDRTLKGAMGFQEIGGVGEMINQIQSLYSSFQFIKANYLAINKHLSASAKC